ncbi:hypothetical protein AC579_9252 [Pseudocercospora musae]|uniref:PhoD-like phosphatase metallophosphatase domain-containing protein n=1 Tax=Pseudocercospora musae TaxID=113226 RepID=A0A139IHE1_9PEZI|nr:hypothetical protein AC579_9252 [Pseudocercospora musae]
MHLFQTFFAFFALAAAVWSGNINHGSHSNNHNLGISLPRARASAIVKNDDSNVTVAGTAALYNHDTQQYVKASSNAICRPIGSQVVFLTINATSWLDGAAYNTGAWDGYSANKIRTLKTPYDNNIGNSIVTAGDMHANWVADQVWLEEKQHNSKSKSGALGVEIAATAVSGTPSFGANSTLWECNNQSRALIADNPELQW